MENNDNEYEHYWEFLQTEELDSYFGEAISAYYDSSSPDGTQSKNITSERNRRRKLNERLYALRSVVPNITKMDKASIIKDAIEHIQSLHEEERRLKQEILELENGKISLNTTTDPIFDQQVTTTFISSRPKRSRLMSSPIELLELRVSNMGEKTIVVSLACSKRTDTMVKLCEMFESLKLKIITANINAFSGRLLKTVFLEADEEEKDVLRVKIEDAIRALNDPHSPMSS